MCVGGLYYLQQAQCSQVRRVLVLLQYPEVRAGQWAGLARYPTQPGGQARTAIRASSHCTMIRSVAKLEEDQQTASFVAPTLSID